MKKKCSAKAYLTAVEKWISQNINLTGIRMDLTAQGTIMEMKEAVEWERRRSRSGRKAGHR